MNLVKRDEFDVLKKMVQKLTLENNKHKRAKKKSPFSKKRSISKKKKTKS